MIERTAIIMAAGQSTRMKTKLPKVLHEVCGRPMLAYVLDACRSAGVDKIIVVVGYGKEQIIERYGNHDDIAFVEQVEQKGTGHAVMCCRDEIKDFTGQTLILCGDAPLIRTETLKTLIEKHESEHSAATLATTILEEPYGYGRIARDEYGNIQGIVEHNDCSEKQLGIKEVNPGYFCFDNQVLLDALEEIEPNNAKNEYYLTDALHITIAGGHKVTAVTAVAPEEAMGVNNRIQLSEASQIMQERIQDKLMNNGVTIVDPTNTWIDVRAKIGQDCVIEPFTFIHGEVTMGDNCRVGPFAYLRDATLEDNVCIAAGSMTANASDTAAGRTTVGEGSVVGACTVMVSPLEIAAKSQIRPGTVLDQEFNGTDKKDNI